MPAEAQRFKGKRVFIIGAGVSGLSAAHELVERGFKVTVFEKRTNTYCKHDSHATEAYGGKARSYRVADDPDVRRLTRMGHARRAAAFGRPGGPISPPEDFPGEHGFRFFPGFYRHLPDTMKRIPAEGGGFVADKLVAPGGAQFASYHSKTPIPFLSQFPRGSQVGDLQSLLDGTRELGLTPRDVLSYFGCLWQMLTSCKERRLAEYEKQSWEDFIRAKDPDRSSAFREYFSMGSTRNLVASFPENASARIIGEVSIQTWMPILFPRPWNFDEAGDRILRGPTQDVWIRPWVDYLEGKGVRFVPNRALTDISMKLGLVHELTFGTGSAPLAALQRLNHEGQFDYAHAKTYLVEQETLTWGKDFDYVVLALPVEIAAKVITEKVSKFDEDLTHLDELAQSVKWMSGIQFYLKDIPDIPTGHVNLVNSPWAITAILQSQSWDAKYRKELAEGGKYKAILSVCVSDWGKPGFNGELAGDCQPDEVAAEVWRQIVRGLPTLQGKAPDYSLDDDLLETAQKRELHKRNLYQNAEPLFINEKNAWALRPRSETRIRNLVLAGDYVRTNTGLACMEAANESARAAVNEILLRSGSTAPRCEIWELPEPDFVKAAQARDLARFNREEPWRDLPGSPMSAAVDAGGYIGKIFEYLRDRKPDLSKNYPFV